MFGLIENLAEVTGSMCRIKIVGLNNELAACENQDKLCVRPNNIVSSS